MRTGKWAMKAVAAGMFMLLLASSGVSRCILLAQEKTDSVTVKIDNFCFTPMELTVTAGTQVIWVNKDDVPHTVVSVDQKFGSKALDTDEKFSFMFKEPGTYKYFCSVHPQMVGRIIVK